MATDVRKLRMSVLLTLLFGALLLHMPAYARDNEVRTIVQTGHDADIKDYDISADGKFLATLDVKGKTVLWDLKTGHQFREFSEENSRSVYFNSRSNVLVIYSRYGYPRTVAYEIISGKQIGYWSAKKHDIKRRPEYLECKFDDGIIRVIDKRQNTIIAELSGKADAVHFVGTHIYNQEGSKIDGQANPSIWWVGERNPVQWNLKTGQVSNRINFACQQSDTIWRDNDGNLVFWDKKNTLSRYRFEDGSLVDKIKIAGEGQLHDMAFLADSITLVYDRDNRIWEQNLRTHKAVSYDTIFFWSEYPVSKWNNGNMRVEKVKHLHKVYSKHKDYHVVGICPKKLPDEYSIWMHGVYTPINMKTGSPNAYLEGGNTKCNPDAIYKLGHGVEIVTGESKISLMANQKLMTQFRASFYTSAGLFYNNKIAVGGRDGSLRLYDWESSQLIETKKPHRSAIKSIVQHPFYQLLLTAADDGTVAIYNTEKSELIAYLTTFDNGKEFIISTPDNYYMSSQYGTNAIRFAVGSDTYSFDQFDLKYNRPDIVLSRIGLADSSQIQMFRRAYEKRLRKMHFTEDMLSADFHVPSLKIKNVEELKHAQNRNQEIEIEADDSKYKVKSINVWINGVPIYGSEGKQVTLSKNVSTTLPVELASGHNTLQVSCFNDRGAESYRQTIEIHLPEASEKPDLWIATIGVSKYKDSRFNLNYASKDAYDLQDILKSVNQQNFKEIHQISLTDNQVTKGQIGKIRDFFKGAKRDDTAVLFYAGHGLVDQSFDYYLGTYDTDFHQPSFNSLSYEELEDMLDGISPLRKLLLLDACHSGEIDKEDATIGPGRTTTDKDIVFRESGANIPESINMSSEQLNSILATHFSNLQRGTGSTIISSASGYQVAMEGDKWKNGLFTYCVMQGLRNRNCDTNQDQKISVSELHRYCQEEVLKLSGGRQQPTSRSENRMEDFVIGRYGN